MKKRRYNLAVLFFMVGLMAWPTMLYCQEDAAAIFEASSVLGKYFSSLKNGDTSEILNLITGPLLKKREGVLKNNTQYGAFLRERYNGANFIINPEAYMQNNRLSLRASIVFSNQQKLNLTYTFARDANDGSLKIYSEEQF
jgi:ABC-type transporter MlaC component